jgi:hypothetical protein
LKSSARVSFVAGIVSEVNVRKYLLNGENDVVELSKRVVVTYN